MDFLNVLGERRSTRAFLGKPLPEKALQKILEAANSAPSAGNLQAYSIAVVQSEDKRKALAQAALGQHFIAQAPLALVFLAEPSRSAVKYGPRGARLYCVQDATLAASFAWLAAVAQGLACAWVGAFDDAAVKKLLDAPAESIPIAVMPVGYAAEKPLRTGRRRLDELVSLEKTS
ncbi:MAG: nitroreductase family protein [Candidatus Micrarchaeota archaeon]